MSLYLRGEYLHTILAVHLHLLPCSYATERREVEALIRHGSSVQSVVAINQLINASLSSREDPRSAVPRFPIAYADFVQDSS